MKKRLTLRLLVNGEEKYAAIGILQNANIPKYPDVNWDAERGKLEFPIDLKKPKKFLHKLGDIFDHGAPRTVAGAYRQLIKSAEYEFPGKDYIIETKFEDIN